MPELPEVETIARGLASTVVGKQIADVQIRLERIVQPEPAILSAGLMHRTIVAVRRRAKYLVIDLDAHGSILVHLRMTGRMMVDDGGCEAPPHSHVTLTFADRYRLHFADVRTLGRFSLVDEANDWQAGLGVEPLTDAFSVTALKKMLNGRRSPIKVLLLDQRHIAGIGNIYACEALWKSGIDPRLAAGDLSTKQITALHASIRDVLALAIEMRGTSSRNYVDAEGLRGGFQNVLSVYGRAGLPCHACAEPIVRSVQAARGTWWCPNCQAKSTKRR